MNNTKERQSNFELMRVISMLFIIIYHICLHSNFIAKGISGSLLVLLISLTYVHVNSYILVTGYFQCKNKIKLSKVFKLMGTTWFWNILWLLIFLVLIPKFSLNVDHTITNSEIIETLLPLETLIPFWFIINYLILYLISPILNKLINTSSKKQLKTIILILLILFSIIPTITRETVIDVRDGRAIFSFIILYFIGAYLRIYPIDNCKLLKKLDDKNKRKIFFVGYLLFSIFVAICLLVSWCIPSGNPLNNAILGVLDEMTVNYLSPIIIIQSIFYFLIFKTIKFNSKFINKIAKYTIGVYLIHENIYVRENLYNWIGISNYSAPELKIIVMVISLAVIIYVLSTLLEMTRSLIFNFISKGNCLKKLKSKYNKLMEKLDLTLNL